MRCGDIQRELQQEQGQFYGYDSETLINELMGRKADEVFAASENGEAVEERSMEAGHESSATRKVTR